MQAEQPATSGPKKVVFLTKSQREELKKQR